MTKTFKITACKIRKDKSPTFKPGIFVLNRNTNTRILLDEKLNIVDTNNYKVIVTCEESVGNVFFKF